jgi:predicted DNA-binding protein (UPF0251 family)
VVSVEQVRAARPRRTRRTAEVREADAKRIAARNAEAVRLYAGGEMTIRAVAAQLGVGYGTVWQALDAAGVVRPRRGGTKGRRWVRA